MVRRSGAKLIGWGVLLVLGSLGTGMFGFLFILGAGMGDYRFSELENGVFTVLFVLLIVALIAGLSYVIGELVRLVSEVKFRRQAQKGSQPD